MNNVTIEDTVARFKIKKDFNDLMNPLGDCGSLALTRSYNLLLKSAPCENLKTRFICKYSKH